MSRYDQERRPEHSTVGDAMSRFRRSPDVFTAGAQHALDRFLNEADGTFRGTSTNGVLDVIAARVLGSIHDLAAPAVAHEPTHEDRRGLVPVDSEEGKRDG